MNGLSPLGRLRGVAVRGHLKRMRPESGGRSESEVVGINCDGGVEKIKTGNLKKNNNISVFYLKCYEDRTPGTHFDIIIRIIRISMRHFVLSDI